MAKIVIDAGHGGADPGAVYQNRQEKEDNLRLALAVGEILQQNGEEVVYTRTEDIYQTPFQKATIANEEGADYFVSIHRNSSPIPNQYSGVETLVYADSGIKSDIAKNINSELEELGFRNIGVKERTGLVVLRRTKMPALLVEAGFINNEEDNQRFDERFDEIAQGIANGILQEVNDTSTVQEYEDEKKAEQMGYRVQVGAFEKTENAEALLYQLQMQGFPAGIKREENLYKVQVGIFQSLDSAVKMEAILRFYGYNTFITNGTQKNYL